MKTFYRQNYLNPNRQRLDLELEEKLDHYGYVTAQGPVRTPEDLLAEKQDLEVLDGLMSGLRPREELAIRCRLGFGCDHPMTLDEVGDKLHVTRERVRQILDKAERKLKFWAIKKMRPWELRRHIDAGNKPRDPSVYAPDRHTELAHASVKFVETAAERAELERKREANRRALERRKMEDFVLTVADRQRMARERYDHDYEEAHFLNEQWAYELQRRNRLAEYRAHIDMVKAERAAFAKAAAEARRKASEQAMEVATMRKTRRVNAAAEKAERVARAMRKASELTATTNEDFEASKRAYEQMCREYGLVTTYWNT